MGDRLVQIDEDLARARKRFLPERGSHPKITRLGEEDGAVSFQVQGFGDFTAFLPDPYPGETTVYGPDDLELEHDGSVEQILEGVLAELRGKMKSQKALELGVLTPTSQEGLQCEASAVVDDVADSEMVPLGRREQIAADLARSRTRFLSEGSSQPQITRLDEEDDAISLKVHGYGEFTIFLPDPYPGDTIVYGPDDLELEESGSLEQIIEGVLVYLHGKLKAQDEPSLDFSPPDRLTAADRATSSYSEVDLDVAPMERLLEEHIAQARHLLGAHAVQHAELADVWRIRLHVALKAISGPNTGEPLISKTTGNAWGVNPELPISIELHIPQTGYLSEKMPSEFVKAVWQDGFSEFQLEKQLLMILSDFGAIMLGRPPLSTQSCIDGDADFSPEQLELVREYEEKKALMISTAQSDDAIGFLGQLALYAQLRITKMHEYCALCDQPFGLTPMLMRTVCVRPLCSHQFASFGEKITSAEGVNTQAEIAELLFFMLAHAAESSRRSLVVDPFPCVYGGPTGKEAILHPKAKDYDKLQQYVSELQQLRLETGPSAGAAWTALVARMSCEASGLMQWIVASNRTYLAPLTDEQRIEDFGTKYQYLLISDTPDKEREFQKLKSQHGSFFAFHGSDLGNWHSILRNGLKNASNTALMANGAAHGAGIYMGRSSAISFAYCRANRLLQAQEIRPKRFEPSAQPVLTQHITGNRYFGNSSNIFMLAVCEVIDHPSVKKLHNMYVAPNAFTVCTRFLLVFDRPPNDMALSEQVLEQIRSCMQRLRVGEFG